MTRLPGSSPLAIMTLRDVRDAGAAGAGLVAFSLSLNDVLWANEPGRAVFGLAPGGYSLAATSVAARQIKASARLVDSWGEARILIRTMVGRSSKAVVATLKRIDSSELVLLTLPDMRPAADSGFAASLLADSGFAAAAIYGADGQLVATDAYEPADTAVLDAIAALAASNRDIVQVDGALTRMTLAQVGKGLVLVRQEPLPAIAERPTSDASPESDEAPAERSFFSVKRRKLSTDRGRMSMNGLLQRWHTRQGEVPPVSEHLEGGVAPQDEAPTEIDVPPHVAKVHDTSHDEAGANAGDGAAQASPIAPVNDVPNGVLPFADDAAHRAKAISAAPMPAEHAGLPEAGSADVASLELTVEPHAHESAVTLPPTIEAEGVWDTSASGVDAALAALRGETSIATASPAAETPKTADEPPLDPVAPAQPRDLESEVILPDIAPEEADTLDVPISDDQEVPAKEGEIPSGLEPASAAFGTAEPWAAVVSEPVDAPATEAAPPQSPVSDAVASDDLVPEPAMAKAVAEMPAAEPADTVRPADVEPVFVPRFDIAPVRFVWQIDREGKFRSLTPEFSAAVGPRAADVAGRSFREVANVFGFDEGGEIARLLDRRDTWSGRSILWPVEASDRKVPVDLAALPIYARDRSFDGFRGFGIVRMNESVADAEAIGMILGDLPVVAETAAASVAIPPAPSIEAPPAQPLLTTFEAAPFGRRPTALLVPPGESMLETPAVSEQPPAVEMPKVIRLEERRRPREGSLSQAEEAAFRAIGMKLGEKSGFAPVVEADPTVTAEAPDGDAGALLPADQPVANEAPEAAAPDESGPADAPEAATDTDMSGGDEPAMRDDAPPQLEATASEEVSIVPVAIKGVPVTVSDDAVPTPKPSGAIVSPWASDLVASPAEDLPGVFPAMADRSSEQLVSLAGAAANAVTEDLPARPAATLGSAGDVDAAEEEAEEVALDQAAADPAVLAAELEAVFASLPLPVLAEAHGILLYANREFQDLTGFESIAALEAAGGLESLFADRRDPLQTRELAIRRSNGQLLDVRVHMQRATFSGRSCLLMSFTPSPRDAVAFVQPPAEVAPGEADLRQQVEELQAVLDTATDGVVLLDPAGTIRAMNGSAHALFGVGQDDHNGRHLSTLFAHESQKATLDYLDMLRDDGLAGILNDGREVIGRVAQGGFIPLFITIGRLSGERGWCVVIRDIAHWKRIEEDLVNARRQAEAASLHKSRFLANISHELRTPLNAIIGFADVMASECFGPIGNERYLEYLGDIKRSGHHVLDLVNDLLDISKIEAGKLDLAFEAVSLNEVVSEVVSLMQPQANRERVIVRSNLPSSVPPVVADRRTMRQIALNLVANAIRFTPAGGQIIASTTYTADGDVLLRFRDSGIGMTEREIEIALTPFQQVHAPSANRGEGTGLGLPLTKAMVEANRALFAITSTPNEGTLVEISFPSQRVLAD